MQVNKRWAVACVLAVTLPILLMGASCGGSSSPSVAQQAQNSSKVRAQTFARASAAIPLPHIDSFPLRAELKALTIAQSQTNHPWYVYVLATATSQPVAYYVSKTYPVNECDTLSNTESVYNDNNGNLVLTSPPLLGLYEGGGGATGSCNAWAIQDESTGAQIAIQGAGFFATNAPLALNVPRLKVSTK